MVLPVECLERRSVAKVWGRRDVPAWAGNSPSPDEPLGEIWYVDPAGDAAELLIKYLFTSERLSIQVHPDEGAARAAGHRRGKDEAWLVLDAEPDAVIGLGLRETLSPDALRAAALDSSIERLLDWRPVKTGDVFYSPAGTIHALGPGLTVLEVQQNLDLTYRLYDYGRPRELHLDEAVAVADPSPWGPGFEPRSIAPGRELLAAGPAFVIERWRHHAAVVGIDSSAPVWLIPIAEGASADGRALEPGTVWTARAPAHLSVPEGAELLIAYSGSHVRSVKPGDA